MAHWAIPIQLMTEPKAGVQISLKGLQSPGRCCVLLPEPAAVAGGVLVGRDTHMELAGHPKGIQQEF